MPLAHGIVSAIGQTPLVLLTKVFADAPFELYGKLEFLNPGGSIKDRPALTILQDALESGEVDSESVIIESSSGNMAVGLVQICCYLDLRLICVLDPRAAPQNLQVLKAYGAEIELVEEPDPDTGHFLHARLDRVRELCKTTPHAYWPNQYSNLGNPRAHYRTTMRELFDELGEVDYVFLATSTCGTMRGCGEFVRDHDLKTKIIAVDARGSMIFSDEIHERHIPGLGAGLKPPHCHRDLIHRHVHVTDADCVRGCRRLVEREAILAGGSSGGVIQAIDHLREEIEPGSRCVAILCDRGERYLDTVYDDQWVREHCKTDAAPRLEFGEPSPLRLPGA